MTRQPTLQTGLLLLDRYVRIRQHSLDLCAPLQAEDYVIPPMTDVRSPKWHLGHTTWLTDKRRQFTVRRPAKEL